jgi:hypothetical protein
MSSPACSAVRAEEALQTETSTPMITTVSGAVEEWLDGAWLVADRTASEKHGRGPRR